MRIPRLCLPVPLAEGALIELDDNTRRHCVTVLRLKPGAAVVLFNGEGGEYDAAIDAISAHAATVRVGRYVDVSRESPLRVHLAQALLKGDRMDYALQKAVELGVARITPITAERCVMRLKPDAVARRLEHWQGVVQSACEQCGRDLLPAIDAPEALQGFVAGAKARTRLVLHPGAQTTLATIEASGNDITLLSGPEGGFTDVEVARAEAAGFNRIAMGPRVLRAESASVAALAAVQTLWGDLAGQGA
ncbi:MAG: 16S rRNA (uracil(1498)-N(3))-methyltransferase [Pseudomonadota bacterium]|nr:MAG: 16S rRNA (uracil(1498)-N(3))-methyltransferase [Pseudomonadota bacterium]